MSEQKIGPISGKSAEAAADYDRCPKCGDILVDAENARGDAVGEACIGCDYVLQYNRPPAPGSDG